MRQVARSVGRKVGPVLGALLLVAVLLVAVFPTRTWLNQRSATERARERLAVLSEQTAALEERTRLLHDDAEIERLAREQYNLVRPGEEAYAVLPPPATTSTTSTTTSTTEAPVQHRRQGLVPAGDGR